VRTVARVARRVVVAGGLLVGSTGTAYAHGMSEYLSVLGYVALLGLVVVGLVFGVLYVVFVALARLGVLRSPGAWAAGALAVAVVVVATIPRRVLPFPLRLRMARMDHRMWQSGFRDDDIPRLVASLAGDRNVDDRIVASWILAGRGAGAVPALIAALDSPDPATGGAAASALEQIGPAARVAIPRVIGRLADEQSGLAQMYELSIGQAAVTLAALGAAAAPALGDLRRAQTARRSELPDPFFDEQVASAIRSICDAVRGTGSVAAECS
jgi:hypothetical protein